MEIKFELFVKAYRGGPDIGIYIGNKLLRSMKLHEPGSQIIKLEADISCPTELVICHHGKDMKRDTQLVDGKIVDDKGFILQKVHIGDLILENELYLFDFINDDGTILKNNNYIGYNGKFVIKIDSSDLTMWYVNLQKSMTNNLPKFDYVKFRTEILNGATYEVTY